MLDIQISDEILKYCPEFYFACIECNITNTFSDKILWEKISLEANELKKLIN